MIESTIAYVIRGRSWRSTSNHQRNRSRVIPIIIIIIIYFCMTTTFTTWHQDTHPNSTNTNPQIQPHKSVKWEEKNYWLYFVAFGRQSQWLFLLLFPLVSTVPFVYYLRIITVNHRRDKHFNFQDQRCFRQSRNYPWLLSTSFFLDYFFFFFVSDQLSSQNATLWLIFTFTFSLRTDIYPKSSFSLTVTLCDW